MPVTNRFDSTYEGLKQELDEQPIDGIGRFDSTYEGLKLAPVRNAVRIGSVSTVPMRA